MVFINMTDRKKYIFDIFMIVRHLSIGCLTTYCLHWIKTESFLMEKRKNISNP